MKQSDNFCELQSDDESENSQEEYILPETTDNSSQKQPNVSFLPIDKKMWQASKAFLKHSGFVASQLNGYNAAIRDSIPSIVEKVGNISITSADGELHTVKCLNVYYRSPTHKEFSEDIIKTTPKMCLDRKIHYVASMYIDIVYKSSDGQTNIRKKNYLGDIPVMVWSDLCNLTPLKGNEKELARLHEDVMDSGGYFILKGGAKVLIPQIRSAHNMISTFVGKNNASNSNKPKFSIYAETKSGSCSSHTTSTLVGVLAKTGLLGVTVPYIETSAIPIGIMFRALGATSEEEIASYIVPPEWFTSPPTPTHKELVLLLVKSIEQGWQCDSQDMALNYIGRRGTKFSNNFASTSAKSAEEMKGEILPENEELIKILEDEDTSKKAISYVKYLLSSEFLPHIGTGEETFKTKRIFLGYMTQKALLAYFKLRPLSDRDHFMAKRAHYAGMLITSQFFASFRQLMNKIIECMKTDIRNKIPVNIASYIPNPSIITTSLISAMTSNKWSCRGQTSGISQALDNFNLAASLSFLRKILTPMNADAAKIELPRHLHGSQERIICPYKTPEGKMVGFVMGLAMASYITVGCDPVPVAEILQELDMIPMDDIKYPSDFLRATKIFINGEPQGYTMHPDELVHQLRELRRSGFNSSEMSIHHDKLDHDIYIHTDPGRCCSVVAYAPNGILRLTETILDEIKAGKWDTPECSAWIKLLEKGYVEVLSKDEEEEMNIEIYPSSLEAMDPRTRAQYTHCELTPDMMEGAGVSTSPHNHRNQAPRNIYQESMSHQSIGSIANASFCRRGKIHVLDNPQRPIISTRISRELGFSDMPMGQNAMLMVMPWYGLGQEDSVIFHEDAVRRGFMKSTAFIAYEYTLKMIESPTTDRYESFEIPVAKMCNDYKGNSSKLIAEGGFVYIPRGVKVEKDDILIGVVVTGTPESSSIFTKNKTNVSIRYEQRWPGFIHSVQYGYDGEGYKYIRVVVAQPRSPVMGDKFSSRYGQKGTIGVFFPTEKMPFVKKYGWCPDIIINPLAFPSRMTIGMLFEMIMGIAISGSALQYEKCFDRPLCLDDQSRKGCTTNMEWMNNMRYPEGFDPEKDYPHLSGDGTPFDLSFNINDFTDALKKMGYNEFAEEIVVNPITGTELKCPIFSTVAYYQRLKHMVVDKIHARSRGNIHALNRQPTEGRAKGGGFRIGYMERDCMLSQGLAYMTCDRLFHQSDEYRLPLCKICGIQCIDLNDKLECRSCNTSNCAIVPIPFGTKLLNQELMAMNICPLLITK